MSVPTSAKPKILLLSLDLGSPFDQIYQRLLGKLNTVASLSNVKEPDVALQSVVNQPPQAVLATDASIAHHPHVYAGLLQYVRNGGTLIFMGNFSSSIKPDNLNSPFQQSGLPWTHADYLRTTVHLNSLSGASRITSLLPCYSQKAVFLANVPVEDAWYLPSDASRTESLVFRSEPVQNLQDTPIAFTSLEGGKLGYIGDVNGEEGSDAVILAMCGLRYL